MQQRLEAPFFFRVGEHQFAHALAVHRARGIDERVAELARTSRDRGAARAGQLVRDGVGVDHRRSESRERVRRRALAAADAAGEADDEPHQNGRSAGTTARIAGPHSSAATPAIAM